VIETRRHNPAAVLCGYGGGKIWEQEAWDSIREGKNQGGLKTEKAVDWKGNQKGLR